MESTWTVRSYLESQRVNGLKWSEKNLRDDIGTFLGRGEAVNRAVAQHLRVILLKTRKVSILLESETHHKFLDQKRSFNAIPSVSPVPVLPNSNIQSGTVQSEPVLSRSVSSKPVKSRKSRPLGYHGKLYRFKRLKAQMNDSDFKLIAENGQKGKLNAFKVLNFQHEANMSKRGIEKTSKLVKQQTGFNVLPGNRLLQKAREATYPEGVISDAFNVEVSLQSAVNKTVERLLQSDQMSSKSKKMIKQSRQITFTLKSGQDGTSGFGRNNKRINRGTSKQQIAVVPLALKATNSGETIWKNLKPNSRRRTRLVKSSWTKESTEHILDTHSNMEDQIQNLQNIKLMLDDVEVDVSFKVHNVMNDGKVLNAVSSKYYKEKGIVGSEAKSLSTQSCHLCGLNTSNFTQNFSCKKAMKDLMSLGFAPMHAAKNSRECILRSAFRKHAVKNYGNKKSDNVRKSQLLICEELRKATGGRFFEPEPITGGNSNTGKNLKLVTSNPEIVAPILDCSEDLLFSLHEVLSMLESTSKQNIKVFETLAENIFHQFKTFNVHVHVQCCFPKKFILTFIAGLLCPNSSDVLGSLHLFLCKQMQLLPV